MFNTMFIGLKKGLVKMKVLCVLNNRKFVVDIVISQAVNALDKLVQVFLAATLFKNVIKLSLIIFILLYP